MTQQTEEQQVAVVKEFLENVCPTGLKTAQGTLSSTDAEKLGQFIDRNYEGVWSIEALKDAVLGLSAVLTWFDKKPESVMFRNQQPRKMSDQALREAGMLPNKVVSHTDDSKPRSQRELMAQIAKNILQTVPEELRNPWKTRAEALVVQNRQGRIDQYLTQELRKILATNTQTGEVDWQRTHNLRVRFQDTIDNRRNMQTRPGRPIG